jgi:hypothetical protein
MVNLIAFNLIDKIKQANCDLFSECIPRYIGRQNSKGMVLYGTSLFEYIGLTDKRGNYFYIRLAGTQDNNFQKERDKLDPSSFNYSITSPLKLVVVFKEYNIELVHLKMTNDLMNVSFNSFDKRRNSKIEIKSSSTNFEKIYKEETGKELGQWNGASRLISFDLDLKFVMDPDDCFQIPGLCEEITYETYQELKAECSTLDAMLVRLQILKNQ